MNLHRLWRAYFAEWDRVAGVRELLEEQAETQVTAAVVRGRVRVRISYSPPPVLPNPPPFPDVLRGMTCGARTRAGTPCKRSDLMRSGRCKLHGGLSTGPKTDGGRARSQANLALRWRCEPVGSP